MPAVRLHGQRYLNPPAFVDGLARSVRERGGAMHEGTRIRGAGTSTGRSRWWTRTGPSAGSTARCWPPAGGSGGWRVGSAYFPLQRVACTHLASAQGRRLRVAGGHGMWGIAWGPLTGQLLAERITTGTTPAELTPFDPLR